MKSLRLLVVICLGCFFASVALAAPVDINNANAAAIAEGLRGVGTARAKAIVDYRHKHGPFKSFDDLSMVKGIGPKVLDENKDNIEFGEPKPKSKKAK